MATKNISPTAKQQFFDLNGDPLVGGLVYTYVTGSSTPLATYTDDTGTSANTNPIVLDSRGECDCWLTPGSFYRFILKTSAGVQIWSVDGLGGGTFQQLYVAGATTFAGAVTFSSTVAGMQQWIAPKQSDEDATFTTGTKFTFRLPACTVLAVRASVKTVSSSGNPTFDINDDGTSIFGAQKLRIDANEKTSTTAGASPTIANPTVADDSEITIDVDTAGTGTTGWTVYLYVKWTS